MKIVIDDLLEQQPACRAEGWHPSAARSTQELMIVRSDTTPQVQPLDRVSLGTTGRFIVNPPETNAYRSSPETRGNHIEVWRGFYWHHGIDMGDGTVIHFSGTPKDETDATIRRDTIESFANAFPVSAVHKHYYTLHPDQVAELATRFLGRTGYDLFYWNCEHFAIFCKTGRPGITDGQIGNFVHEVSRSGFFIPGLDDIPIVGPPVQIGVYAATGLFCGGIIFLAKNVMRGIFPAKSNWGFSRQGWDDLMEKMDNVSLGDTRLLKRRSSRSLLVSECRSLHRQGQFGYRRPRSWMNIDK
jgi:Lecithin retinol acyltransferase